MMGLMMEHSRFCFTQEKDFLLRDLDIETDMEITLNECRILRDLYTDRQFSKENHRVYASKYMQHYKQESIYFRSTFGSQYKLDNFHLASLTEFVSLFQKQISRTFLLLRLIFPGLKHLH